MSADELKVHEVVAIRKGIKSRTYSQLTELHKSAQKGDLYSGMSRSFRGRADDGESLPGEDKRVQLIAADVLKRVRQLRREFFNVEVTQDWGNLKARAGVVVSGVVVLEQVLATLLIFLEKELNDLRTLIEAMPTLDTAKTWSQDPNSKLLRSDTSVTHKTKKVQRAIALYDATEHHPAQTQLTTEDQVIGHWHTTPLSGALSVPREEQLVERIEQLRNAVKRARARANDVGTQD